MNAHAKVVPAAREEIRITPDGASGGWLIVLTKGGCERKVRDRLVAQGFEVYLPLRLLTDAQAKRRGVEGVPLFPRLLFARATLDAYRWQAIFNTIHVTRVLCDPARPRGLRPEFVERLRREEIGGYLKIGLKDPHAPVTVAPPKDRRQWVKLDQVVAGLLDEAVDEDRKSVLLSLMNEGRASLTQALR